jgi:segregation and condensation protein B
MSDSETRRALEAILFVADEPVGTSDLAVLLEMGADVVESHLIEMGAAWDQQNRGIVLRQVAEGWRIATHPAAAPYLERFVADHRSPRLTQAALETLAIVAYRQPMSRGQIAEIRGTSSEGVIKTLIARGLVAEIGRDEGPGQAILYGVTTTFLERLGLNSVSDLPPLPQFMPDTEAVERMESGLGPGV